MTEQIVISENKRLTCECGCDNIVSKIGNRFINGHQNREKNHPSWKGGRIEHEGYWLVMCKGHHRTNKNGYMLEHDLIFERVYKCHLLDWGIVHHINRIRDDNRIENLQGMTRSQHITLHNSKDMSGRQCSKCGSYETYIRKRKGELKPEWRTDDVTGLLLCVRCKTKQYGQNSSNRERKRMYDKQYQQQQQRHPAKRIRVNRERRHTITITMKR